VVEVVVVREFDAQLATDEVGARSLALDARAAAAVDAPIGGEKKGDVDPELQPVVIRGRERQPLDWAFRGAHSGEE
jgi:hypothetical protein